MKHSALFLNSMRVERTYTGGKLLDEWQGIKPGKDGLMPEEWVASVIPSRYAPDPDTGYSKIRNPEWEGLKLIDYIARDPEAILGKRHYKLAGENPGFLVKIIDSDYRLNIQTHPDRAKAKEYFNSDYGKTEAWYVIDGRTFEGEEPYILMGFKPGMTRAKWKSLIEKQDRDAMVDCMHKIPIQKGDVFLIESGLPHAIGSGCMIVEIQEPTDITFRVEKVSHPGKIYPEETYHQGIGYEKMYDCFDYTPYTEEEILKRTKKAYPPVLTETGSEVSSLIKTEDTPFFSMEKVAISSEWKLDNSLGFSVALVLKGGGKLNHGEKDFSLKQGDEIFLPCSNEPYDFKNGSGKELNILMFYPPGHIL